MALVNKTLGQVATAATTATTLYTVPASTSAICSTLVVCNQSATPATFRVAVRVAALALTGKQYTHYDVPLSANNTYMATIGLTLAASDVVTVYASTANLSFSLFGSEIT